MVDFIEILSKKAEEVEKPKPRPTGKYQAIVQGMPKQVTRTMQGEEVKIMQFSCKVVAPIADVDEEQLAAVKDPIQNWRSFNKEFWLQSEDDVFALVRFLENVLDISKTKKSISQMCAEAAGKPLGVELRHRPFTNKNTNEMEIATEIGSVFKL